MELENYKYAPPSIGSSSSSARANVPYDPIDFRQPEQSQSQANSSSVSVANISEAIGSTASKLYGAASSAISTAQNIDAWSPLHKQTQRTSSSAPARSGVPGSAHSTYSSLPTSATAPPANNGVDDELTL